MVFATALVVYVWTACPAAGWLDSPELVAAAVSLGVPHSPGHPIPLLLGKAVSLLPLGDTVFRTNAASGLAVAAAASATYSLALSVMARAVVSLPRRLQSVLAAAAALGFAASFAAWHHAVRAEVYGAEAALAIAMVALFFKFDETGDRRFLYLAALASGLALATHNYITVLVMVPLGVAFVQRHWRWRRAVVADPTAGGGALAWQGAPTIGTATIGRLAAVVVLGLAVFLYLPIRASRHPPVCWSHPDSVERFAWVVSAKAFQKALAFRPMSDSFSRHPLEGALVLGDRLVAQVGSLSVVAAAVVVVVAIAGATGAIRRRLRRRSRGQVGIALGADPLPDNPPIEHEHEHGGDGSHADSDSDSDSDSESGQNDDGLRLEWRRRRCWAALLLAGVVLANAAGLLLIGFDPFNPDAYGYLLPGIACLVVLAWSGFAAVAEALVGASARLRPLVIGATMTFAASYPLVQAVAHAEQSSLRDATASDSYSRRLLDGLPSRALLFTAYFETLFQLWELTSVEGSRPDVILVDRGILGHPGATEDAVRKNPELGTLLAPPWQPGRPLPAAGLTEIALRRPVFLELYSDIDDALFGQLAPLGPFAAVLPHTLRDWERDEWEKLDLSHSKLLLQTTTGSSALQDRIGASKAILWSAYLRARAYCLLERPAAMGAALETARSLAPTIPCSTR
ncbi:MAG: DUF2723 domain-containing protein [Pseudomonadota bacterium]